MRSEPLTVRDGRKPGWFHIDNEIIDHYGRDVGAIGVAVYCALARYADRDGRAFPSHQRLAENLHIARNTLKAALRRLEELELITIVQQTDKAGNPISTNIYTLCPMSQQEGKKARRGVSAVDQGGSANDTPLSADDPRVSAVDQGGSSAAYEEDSYNQTHVTTTTETATNGSSHVVVADDSFFTELRKRGVGQTKARQIASMALDQARVLALIDNRPDTGNMAKLGGLINDIIDGVAFDTAPRARAVAAPIAATRPNVPESTVAPAEMLRMARERR